MFVEIVRLFMVALGTAGGFWVARDAGWANASDLAGAAAVVGCLAGYVGGGVLGRLLELAMGIVERRASDVPPAGLVAGFTGAAGGGMLGALLVIPLVMLLPQPFGLVIGGLVAWTAAYAGMRLLSNRSTALLEMLGLSDRPLVRARAFDAGDGMLVDSSVLMDGRLPPLARSGLLGRDLLVAPCVLDELQAMADARDGARARRARRALESLESLRRESSLRLFVLDDEVPEFEEVDAKLVALALRLQLRLLTNDAALAAVAEARGVPTCNLRRLAADLAPELVPGDVVRVALTAPGREAGQGVGHLDDGSMVVVNEGDELIGEGERPFEVSAVVPTSMGRLVFARPPVGVER
jgi:uncharacterized protein YacL